MKLSKQYNQDLTYSWFNSLPFEPPKNARLVSNYKVDFQHYGSPATVSFSVYVYKRESEFYYIVKEPYMSMELKSRLISFMKDLDYQIIPSLAVEIDPVGHILSYLEKTDFSWLVKKEINSVLYYLTRDVLGYWLVDPLVRDPEIEDISCDGLGKPVRVWHRTYSQSGWLETNVIFNDSESLDSAVLRLVHKAGRSISIFSPIVDTILENKFRLAATFGNEVSGYGSSFTIRKQRSRPFTIAELIKNNFISKELAAYLWMLLDSKGFVFICGPPASGKTTLLNSLVSLLNPSWKIVTIEDTMEVNLPQKGWKPLHTKPGPSSVAIELFELVKLSLRERPDFVVLGETRGMEVTSLFQAALSGSGCITTFHAPDYDYMVARLTQPPLSVSKSLIELIDCAVFLSYEFGKRVIRCVVENNNGPTTLFSVEGKHQIDSVEGSSKLFRKMELLGLSYSKVNSEYTRRINFLEYLVNKGIMSVEELGQYLTKFYADLDNFS